MKFGVLKNRKNMTHPLDNLELSYPKYKILFKYPCRGRKELFFESLNSIYINLVDKVNFHVNCTIDTDDEILNSKEVKRRLSEYENLSISLGVSASKVEAVNRNMPKDDWDIVICWSNDMIINLFGFDDLIRHYMYEAFGEEFDGLFHLPEQDSMESLNVLYIATRKYFDRFNYIYHPSYLSLFCDNESLETAKLLGRYKYNGTLGVYTHKNPAYSKYNMERDELFNRQQDMWNIDEATYHKRKQNNFDIHLLKK
jgi:hypothetical protein